jgi:signal transduction histidine kinase
MSGLIMNPTIVTLGIDHKNINHILLKYDIKAKNFSKIRNLKDYVLVNRVDLCIFINDSIKNKEELNQFIDNNPEIIYILITDISPDEVKKNVYYISNRGIDDQSATSFFLHNLITFVKNIHQREELTAMILHDTRSPITSMIGYLELLENGIFGALNAGQSQILSNVMLLGDLVIELIEDLNLIYQLEQKELNIKKTTFDLVQIFEEVLVALWIQADQKDIKIHKMVDKNIIKVLGDSGKIQRVFMNLITNAIKFSPPKSKIDIEIKLIPDSRVKISISDNGPGIDENLKNKIFSKYYKSKKTKEKDKGFGLGLYISKSIIEAHGGTIQVKNNKSGGCTFSFILPIKMD